jgi:phage-related protein
VLHAFQKKSKKGISTPKEDIDLIKQRLGDAKEIAKDE